MGDTFMKWFENDKVHNCQGLEVKKEPYIFIL
jgi:hypothetical protein